MVENSLKVSVAIITRNRAFLLKEALETLVRQTITPYEILVIDNASTDDTVRIISRFKSLVKIRYIKERKVGIPFARNTALRLASGDILAFTDDDCRPPRNWIRKIVEAHRINPDVLLVQGKTTSLNPNSVRAILYDTNYNYWIWKNRDQKNFLSVCDTNNLSLKLNKVRKLRVRFDTSLKLGSDVDFGKRVLREGGKICYVPGIRNYHLTRGNWVSFFISKVQNGLGK